MAFRDEDVPATSSGRATASEDGPPSRPPAGGRVRARGPQPSTVEARSAAVAPLAVQPVAESPPKRSRKRAVLLAVLLVAAVAAGWFGYGWWTSGRFMISTDDAYVAADTTVLAAKVSGYVTSIEVADNQSVEAGQVIARIDDTDYRLALQAANDKVSTQAATVQRIGRQIEAAQAQVAQAEPQIAAARAEQTRSAADFDRQERLSQSDFASRARFEQSRADRDRALANVKGAEAGLLLAQANVAVLKAQQEEAERTAGELRTAALRAERDLSFTSIKAPVAGIVANRAIFVGSYAQPGTRLAALVSLATVHVDANFKETQLGQVRPGQKVHLEVDAYPGRDFPAVVESIAPATGSQFSLLPPENATGNFTKIVQRATVRVKVQTAEAGGAVLRPGLSVVVKVDSRDRPAAAAASAR